jgi:hypothetical protein
MGTIFTLVYILVGILVLVLVIAFISFITWIFSPKTKTVTVNNLVRKKVSTLYVDFEKNAFNTNYEHKDKCAKILLTLEEIALKDAIQEKRGEAALALAHALKYPDFSTKELFSTLLLSSEAAADPQIGCEIISNIRFALPSSGKPSPEQQLKNDFSCQLMRAYLPAQPVEDQKRKIHEILSSIKNANSRQQAQDILMKIGPALLPALEEIFSSHGIPEQEWVVITVLFRLASQNNHADLASSVLSALPRYPIKPSNLAQVITCAQQMAPQIVTPEQKERFNTFLKTAMIPADYKIGREILDGVFFDLPRDGQLTPAQKVSNDFACEIMQAYLPGQPIDDQVKKVSEILWAANEPGAKQPAKDILAKIGLAVVPAVEEIIRNPGTPENAFFLIPVLFLVAVQNDRDDLASSAITAICNFPLRAMFLPHLIPCLKQIVPLIATSEQKKGLSRVLWPWWKSDPKQMMHMTEILSQLGWIPATIEDRVLFYLASNNLASIYSLGADAYGALVHHLEYPDRSIVVNAYGALVHDHHYFLRCPACLTLCERSNAVEQTMSEYLTDEQSYYREAREYKIHCCPKCSKELRIPEDSIFFH